MIKVAHKYWADESGGYDKEEIMVDAFVEGYKQAFALCNVVGQSEQLRAFKKFLQSDYHLPVSNRMVDEFEQRKISK